MIEDDHPKVSVYRTMAPPPDGFVHRRELDEVLLCAFSTLDVEAFRGCGPGALCATIRE